jgi:RNA recognition motif-containing protein
MTEMVDTIFVTGLNEEITEDALVNHFGSIGVIKVSIVNKNGTC